MNRSSSKKAGRKPAVAKASVVVSQALAKSWEVKGKIAQCADDLSSTNHQIKTGLALGDGVQVTRNLLASTRQVEGKALECVEELQDVNASLIDGVDDLKRTEQALAESRAALAASQLALAHALAAIEKVRDLALHDHLTGLPNRQLFEDRLNYAIALAARREWNLAVMFLDLDGFKAINDELGHGAGDEVLSQTAKRLAHKVRFADTVCRYGGDEFVLLLMNPQARSNIERIAQEVLDEIAAPIQFGDRELRVGASLGIAIYPDQAQDGMTLISGADAAMYVAKKSPQRIAFV